MTPNSEHAKHFVIIGSKVGDVGVVSAAQNVIGSTWISGQCRNKVFIALHETGILVATENYINILVDRICTAHDVGQFRPCG